MRPIFSNTITDKILKAFENRLLYPADERKRRVRAEIDSILVEYENNIAANSELDYNK